MSELKGGCACGLVAYIVKGDSQFSFHCKCRQCQKITGAGHASQFMINLDAVTISGELKYYDQPVDDHNTKSSGFCLNCGSPILTKVSGSPELLFFHAATLDDPSQFQPKSIAYSSSGQPWDYTDPDLEVL